MFIRYCPPFKSALSIHTNCNRLYHALKAKYGNYISTTPNATTVDISILKRNGTYVFRHLTDEHRCDAPLLEIDHYLTHHTNFHPDIFALHGAAVECRDKCFLLLASTGSGKTTLTAYLTNKGFGYLTDDCILLSRVNLTVFPFTTPLHIRDGGLQVLEQYDSIPSRLELLEELPTFRRFVYTPSKCITIPLPLTAIFFIKRTNDTNRLQAMSTTERMTEMMKAPITDYTVDGDYLRFLSRLVKLPCYQLCYHDMNYVLEVLQHECPSEL